MSAPMIDVAALAARFDGPLADWVAGLGDTVGERLAASAHGDLPRWLRALDELPVITPSSLDLDAAAIRIGTADDADAPARARLEAALRALCPWRKGPFSVFGVEIDTEWRSDLKWDRLIGALEPLPGRRVLDVGCGSGYHVLRMAGAGADTVVGVEPMPLYVLQFLALQRYLDEPRAWVLPLRLEELPAALAAFDSVFSMGVMYHRRAPLDHLAMLKDALAPGGQLVLETLVVAGGDDTLMFPEDRYAGMRNVWLVPSVAMLVKWLKRLGFTDHRVVDISPTTGAEQRRTDWMRFDSLAESLDPSDARRTREGHPAPLRAVVTARRR